MKRILLGFIALLGLCSCEKIVDTALSIADPKIWDIGPVVVLFEVNNSNGDNLFAESTEGNWLNASFSCTFEDETYTYPSPETKEYIAVLRGLYLNTSSETPFLEFGELDGTENRNSDLVITWPDGTQDVITIKHTFRWKLNGNPDGHTTLKLNGEKTSHPIQLVK